MSDIHPTVLAFVQANPEWPELEDYQRRDRIRWAHQELPAAFRERASLYEPFLSGEAHPIAAALLRWADEIEGATSE